MKKTLKIIAIVFLLLLVILLCLGVFHVNSSPTVNILALPVGQVSLNSEEGQKRLSESRSYSADYLAYKDYFEPQEHVTFCGVASSVSVINALSSENNLNQISYFIEGVKSALTVKFSGMTLAQLHKHFRLHNIMISEKDAPTVAINSFRQFAKDNFSDASDFVVVNYDRKLLDQVGGGHISPVVAYHKLSDSMLVMDVAAHKYPPTWIKTGDLVNAMNTIDSSTGINRGYLVVSARGNTSH